MKKTLIGLAIALAVALPATVTAGHTAAPAAGGQGEWPQKR